MRIVAAVMEPVAVERILGHRGERPRRPSSLARERHRATMSKRSCARRTGV
jgi:hypothetical protein